MQNKLFKNSHLSNSTRVVAIGGGTGLGRLLSSLSFLGENLTGIVATTDNGGSTGKLREETGCMAWGDLRNCLGQLTCEQNLKKQLFDFRFEQAGNLSGHSLGNLMLLALDDMCVRPLDTINMFRQFLDVSPLIFPMTETPAHLFACDQLGCDIFGEVNIDAQTKPPLSMRITPSVSAPREAIEAINEADLIILGPGSFFTSILPPLLVTDIRKAIAASKAPRFFIASMEPEKGAASKLGLEKKLTWFDNYLCPDAIDLVIWPTSRTKPSSKIPHIVEWELYDKQHPRMHNLSKLEAAIQHAFSLNQSTMPEYTVSAEN